MMGHRHENGGAATGKPEAILLLTATIKPSELVPANLRADPDLRRRDYESALKTYLAMPELGLDKILFVENSGADLGSLRELAERDNPHGRAVKFLQFVSDAPPERGKSYGEMDLLDHAYDAVMSAWNPATKIWKVTGRLVVGNLGKLVSRAPGDYDIYGDFRQVPLIGDALGGNDWLDTRIISFSVAGYRRWLYDTKADATPYPCIERQWFAKLRPFAGQENLIVPRFRTTPRISGICGGTNETYDDARYLAKYYIRQVGRSLAPGLWL